MRKIDRKNLDIPGTQMTLVLVGKCLLLEGSNPQNKGQTGSTYIYIHISTGFCDNFVICHYVFSFKV